MSRQGQWWSARFATLILMISVMAPAATFAQAPTEDRRPNFVIIVADDLGFSDLGSYGGEISTPNLDRLAGEGVRFTNFYVGPTCSVTRSMLMTGRDNHTVGMGNMYERTAPNQLDQPGYEGVLSTDVPTFSELMRESGYRTYMTGKWHLGHAPTHIPHARGFDRSFSLLNAAGSHFDMTGSAIENEVSEFTLDDQYLTELPKDYYSTLTFTDQMIEFLEDDRDNSRPFVAYLAHQAPHDPLQVPKPWLRRYTGTYDFGWDFARQTRMARMSAMGIMPAGTAVAPRLWYVPEFADLVAAAQVVQTRKMEIYASMVEYLDNQVGKLVEYLEESGQLDNTIILFFSDNGPEGSDPIPQALQQPNLRASNFYANNYDTQYEAWGREYGYVAYGPPWAQVSATPFNHYKGAMSEGGVRSPLIVWQPGDPNASTINTEAVVSVLDIAPTMMELAGIDAPEMQGESWANMLRGLEASPRDDDDIIAMEFQSARMVRRGSWKALLMPEPFGIGDWQLFDIVSDPAEQNDLSNEYPEIMEELTLAWDDYAAENNVILPNRTFYDGMPDLLPPKPPVPSGSYPRGQEPNFTGSSNNE